MPTIQTGRRRSSEFADEITGLENQIADRHEFYNESVNRNNITLEEFPDVVIARMLNFREAQLLRFEEHEKADVDVGALFKS